MRPLLDSNANGNEPSVVDRLLLPSKSSDVERFRHKTVAKGNSEATFLQNSSIKMLDMNRGCSQVGDAGRNYLLSFNSGKFYCYLKTLKTG